MQPVNSKSLFHFITGQMEKLSKREIEVEEATAQSSLARQAVSLLNYELKRCDTLMRVSVHNQNQNFKKIDIREIESKAFDDTFNAK